MDEQLPKPPVGLISTVFYFWLNSLLRLGYRQPLQESNLSPAPATFQTEQCTVKLEQRRKDIGKGPEVSLIVNIWKEHKSTFIWTGISRFFNGAFQTCFPLFINVILSLFVSTAGSRPPQWTEYVLTAGILLLLVTSALLRSHCERLLSQVSIKVNAAIHGTLYQKLFSLSISAQKVPPSRLSPHKTNPISRNSIMAR
jgi:ABC-type bacteriocin/lantibiotic exporter with double-glycine peptidase domain